jgi:hypothetical protein
MGPGEPLYDLTVATHEDVRRIAASLGGLAEDADTLAFRANGRLVAWLWLERIDPKKKRMPNPDVLVVRVRDEMDKQTLLDLQPATIFTEPHYDGYSAVLVRLPVVGDELLARLITDAWELQSAKPPPQSRRK